MVRILQVKHPKIHLFRFNSLLNWSTKLARFSLPIGENAETNRFFVVSFGFLPFKEDDCFCFEVFLDPYDSPLLSQILSPGLRLSVEFQRIYI